MGQNLILPPNLIPMSTPLTEGLSPNLLEFIAQQQVQNVRLQEVIVQQQARIEVLENEITRL